MRVLLAPDKFKGTLSSRQVADLLAGHLTRLKPGWECVRCPMADGGDGTLETLQTSASVRVDFAVTDALGRAGRAFCLQGRDDAGEFLAFESASCLSLSAIEPAKRDPLIATSHGLGGLLRQALLRLPHTRLVVALGGTATVDGGLGFLQALGADIQLESGGRRAPLRAGDMEKVFKADLTPLHGLFKGRNVEGWCDVVSPLLGPEGAARMFAPQKGAGPQAVERLEKGMSHWAARLEEASGRPLRAQPGAGAAGGLGMAVLALGGRLANGFEAVSKTVGLEGKIRDCDAVVTGEGRLDASTRLGKAPWGVLLAASRAKKPCWAVVGSAEPGAEGWEGVVALVTEGRGVPEDPSSDAIWEKAARELIGLIEG